MHHLCPCTCASDYIHPLLVSVLLFSSVPFMVLQTVEDAAAEVLAYEELMETVKRELLL